MLGEMRRSGFPQARAQRGSGTTFSALQEAWSGMDSGDRQGRRSDYWSSEPINEERSRPRPAPQLDDAAAWHGYGSPYAGDRFHLTSSGSGSGMSPVFSQPAFSPSFESAGASLMQLQIKLSELVTQPMMQWNFTQLKEQVRQVIQFGDSPVERGQARLLMERIEDFEQLAVRSGYFIASANNSLSSGPGVNFGTVNRGPVNEGPPVQTASYNSPERSVRDDSRIADSFNPRGGPTMSFDASGWLVPVHASTSGQPTHAITDDSGQIVAYVTGLPGMNLDRYINQAVGIHGLRGFLPQFQAAHIEAQNVVRLR